MTIFSRMLDMPQNASCRYWCRGIVETSCVTIKKWATLCKYPTVQSNRMSLVSPSIWKEPATSSLWTCCIAICLLCMQPVENRRIWSTSIGFRTTASSQRFGYPRTCSTEIEAWCYVWFACKSACWAKLGRFEALFDGCQLAFEPEGLYVSLWSTWTQFYDEPVICCCQFLLTIWQQRLKAKNSFIPSCELSLSDSNLFLKASVLLD